MKKLALLAPLAALAVSVPAVAAPSSKPTHPTKPATAATPSHGSKSHKCKPHGVAYVIGGTLVSGALTANTDGTYSGTVTVHVTQVNHHAKGDKATDKAYTLDHAKLNLNGEDPAALVVGSKVKLIGKITTIAKKCDHTGFTATTTFKRGTITPPAPPAPAAS